MPAFPVLNTDEVVQVGDKFRLDATGCFAAGGASITKVEIQPESGADWVDVTSEKYLDWVYTTAGAKTATARVTDGASATSTATAAITAVTEAADKLFSSDAKLKQHQSDIHKFLPEGRSSFRFQHRRAQTLMLDWLAKEGYTDSRGERLTKSALVVTEDVESWATFTCLRLIYEDASNATDDVFAAKAKTYDGLAKAARDRSVLGLDEDGDGVAEVQEGINTRGATVVRR